MIAVVRRIGIAIGAFMIGWLAVSLVAGWFLGPNAYGSFGTWVLAGIVGAAVYRDILRRERHAR